MYTLTVLWQKMLHNSSYHVVVVIAQQVIISYR